MKNKKYWGLGVLVVLFISVSFALLIRKVDTPNVVIPKPTVKDIDQNEKEFNSNGGRFSSNIPGKDNQMTHSAPSDDNSFESKLKELRSLSLSELIPHLKKMPPADVRKLENVEWYGELLETQRRSLTSEELVALETIYRASQEGKWEREYEEHFGYPAPPPGYAHVSINGGPREIIKQNTPIVRIEESEQEAYESWDMLSDDEWEQYKRVNSLTTGNDELWEHWDIQVSPEVAARADEIRQQLYEKSWGPIKTRSVSVYGSWSRDKTPADEALIDRLRREAHAKLAAETPENGLRGGGFGTNRDDVIELLRQIEAELNQ